MSTLPGELPVDLEALRLRARLNALIRGFFAERAVLEVETPVLSAAGNTEPNICLLYTSPSPRDLSTSRMPSSA